jgi:hypothetical protein
MAKEANEPKSAAKPLSGAETSLSATRAKLAQIVVLATTNRRRSPPRALSLTS